MKMRKGVIIICVLMCAGVLLADKMDVAEFKTQNSEPSGTAKIWADSSDELQFKDSATATKSLADLVTAAGDHGGLTGLADDDHDTGANAYHTATRHTAAHDSAYNDALAISADVGGNTTIADHMADAGIHAAANQGDIYYVDEGGDGDYSTITAALAAATTASPTAASPIFLVLSPGTYDENTETFPLVVPDFCSIVCYVSRQAQIDNGSGSAVTMQLGRGIRLVGLSIENSVDADLVELTDSGGNVYIDDCELYHDGSNDTVTRYVLDDAASTNVSGLWVHNSYLHNNDNGSDQSMLVRKVNVVLGTVNIWQFIDSRFLWYGNSSGSKAIDLQKGDATYFLGCSFRFTSSTSGTDAGVFIDSDSANPRTYIQNCEFRCIPDAALTTFNCIEVDTNTDLYLTTSRITWLNSNATQTDIAADSPGVVYHANNAFDSFTTSGTGTFTALNMGDVTAADGLFDTITIGTGAAGVDPTLTFDGEDSDGILKFNEDNATFDFDQPISWDDKIKLGYGAGDSSFERVDLEPIDSSKYPVLYLKPSTGGSGAALTLGTDDGARTWTIDTSTQSGDNYMRLYTLGDPPPLGAGVDFTMNEDGYIGIGKYNAGSTYLLDVNGNTNIVGDLDWSGTATGDLVVLGSSETLDEFIEDTVSNGVLDSFSVSDDGGLNFSWSAGEVYVNGNIIDVNSGSTTVTDDDRSYFYATVAGGATLQESTTAPTGEYALVAIVDAFGADIAHVFEEPVAADLLDAIEDQLDDLHNGIVSEEDDLVVAEDADATNANDFTIQPGAYYLTVSDLHTIPSVLYSAGSGHAANNVTRHYHSSGSWTTESSNGVDFGFWDNGTDKTAVNVAKYYSAFVFIINTSTIAYVYPQTEHNSEADALAEDIVYPPTQSDYAVPLAQFVFRGVASAFGANAYFVDIRRLHAGTLNASINLQPNFLTVDSDSGSTTADNSADTLTIAGGTLIDTSISGDTVTVAADSNYLGVSSNVLLLNDGAADDISCFASAAEGETPEFNIYGYRTSDASRSLQIGVGVDAADTASFGGVSNYYFDGNVGIGTTGPDAKVDSLATSGAQFRATYTDGSVYTDFTTDSSGYLNIQTSGGVTDVNGTMRATTLETDGSTPFLLFDDNSQQDWEIHTGVGDMHIGRAYSDEYLTFKDGGNVGIGTTGPDAKVDSLATSGAQFRATYTDGSVYTDFMTDSSGYLTVAPSGDRLYITGDWLELNDGDASYLHFNTTQTGTITTVRHTGHDDGANDTIYAESVVSGTDDTDTAEDGQHLLKVMKGGALAGVRTIDGTTEDFVISTGWDFKVTDYSSLGGHESFKVDLIQHTVDAGDVTAGYFDEAWSTATTAKVVNITACVMDDSDANDTFFFGAGSYDDAGTGFQLKGTYDGTNIRITDDPSGSASINLAAGDVVSLKITYIE